MRATLSRLRAGVLLLFGLLALPLAAQPTERLILSFPIESTIALPDGRVEVEVPRSAVEGLFVGATGQVRAVHQHGQHGEHSAGVLGSAEVVSVSPGRAVVHVVPAYPDDPQRRIALGDVIELPADVPAGVHRGPLFDLVTYGIVFLDERRRPIYDRAAVLTDADGRYEAAVLDSLAAIVHATYRRFRDEPSFGHLNEPLAEGQFAGRSIFDVMGQASRDDLRSFFGFIDSYPGKYLGGYWRIDETFATWVLERGPYGQTELRDVLLAEANPAERLRIARENRRELTGSSYYGDWGETALDWMRAGRRADAERLLERAAEAAAEAGDAAGQATTFTFQARLALLADDHAAALAAFERAGAVFAAIDDRDAQARVTAQAGFALIEADRYAEALGQFEALAALRERQADGAPSPEAFEVLGQAHQGRGRALRALGRNEEALAAYQAMHDAYARSNTRLGLERQAFALTTMGSVLGAMGDPAGALARHDEARERYRALGDAAGEADAEDERGYQLSLLGRNEEALAAYEASHRLDLTLDDFDDAGFSMSQVGQVLWRLGRIEDAIAAHEEAIALRERAGRPSGQAYSWLKLGALYRERGTPNDALDAYARAAALYDEAGRPSGRAEVLDHLGDQYYALGDYLRAAEHYVEAAAIYASLGAQAEQAAVLYDLGDAYYMLRQYDRALEPYEQSLALRRAVNDLSGQIYSLVSLAVVHELTTQDYAAALASYTEAAELAAGTGSTEVHGMALLALGRHHRGQARYAEAAGLFDQALALYRASGDRAQEAQALYDLGLLAELRGDFAEALALYEQTRTLAAEAGRSSLVADALNNASFAVLVQGDYRRAEALQRESLALYEAADNPWGVGAAHVGLGNVFNARADYRAALAHYTTADSLYAALGVESARATSSNNIGTIYYWQGDLDRSLAQFEHTLALYERTGIEDNGWALALTNMGEVLLAQQRYDAARERLEAGLALAERIGARRHEASAQRLLGRLALEQGRTDEARAHLAAARALYEQTGEHSGLVDVALLEGRLHTETGDLAAAAEALDRALADAERAGADKLRWEPLYRRALVHRARGEADAAIARLEEAVEVLTELQAGFAGGDEARRLFASGRERQAVYETLGELLFEKGRFGEAQYYFQRDTDEQLRQQAASVQYADAATEAVVSEARRLRAERDLARDQAQRIRTEDARHTERDERLAAVVTVRENEYQRFLSDITQEQPELTALIARTIRPEELAHHIERIPADVAVVTYWMGAHQLFATILTADGVTGKRIPIAYDSLRVLVEQVHALVQQPGETAAAARGERRRGVRRVRPHAELPGDLNDLAAALYERLIEPLEAEIAGRPRLAIVPSGPLSYLPFALLGRPGADGAMRYLAEDVTLFHLSTLAPFSSGPPPEAPLRIVAFGNADESLPSAEAEVRTLAERFPDARVFLRGEATRARVRELPSGYNVLHFATHGVLDYVHPDSTYLALAPDPASGDDGHLTIADVRGYYGVTGLRGFRLVTLSACNTALTSPGAEDALIRPAPAYAFLSTGARSAVATLWEVDDAATARFMETFYAHVSAQGAAEALRTAQATLRAEEGYDHPFYWAPFVLLGHWH